MGNNLGVGVGKISNMTDPVYKGYPINHTCLVCRRSAGLQEDSRGPEGLQGPVGLGNLRGEATYI